MRLSGFGLVLRTPVEQDVTMIVAAVRASLPELAPWMPWATEAYDAAAALEWIRSPTETHPFLIEHPDGSIAGSCGLNSLDELNKRTNLGYWVRTDMANQGIATNVTRLLARHALADLDLVRIEVIMSVHNEASRRVAENAGARYEGVLRHRLVLHDTPHDVHSFSFTQDDLPALNR